MKISNGVKNILIPTFFIALFSPLSVLAVCPVCSIAVAGGLGISRWLGIDDVVSGIWVGGLIVSLITWFILWLNKKNIKFKFRQFLVVISFYLIVILPLYWAGFISYSCNQLWGFNKLLIGIFFGSLTFSLGVWIHDLLKKKNNNKVYFSFQKVIIPVLFLIIASIIFYFVTKC